MKIDEIPQGGEAILEIQKDKLSIEVKIEIADVVRNGIILNPIIINGRALNLSDLDISLTVIYERQGEKPLIWRGVTHKVFRQGNYPRVVIFDKKDGVPYNRRGLFRLPLGVRGILLPNLPIIVNDISGSGISFFTAANNEKDIGTQFKLTFTAHYEEMTVSGQVVRKQEFDTRMLHGCTINGNPRLEKFINEEQARRARALR